MEENLNKIDSKREIGFLSDPIKFQKIILLQKKENILTAWEDYYINKAKGINTGMHYIIARLKNYWADIRPRWLRNNNLKLNIAKVDKTLLSKNEEELKKLTDEFMIDLDTIKFSRVDTTQEYDQYNIEEDNSVRG